MGVVWTRHAEERLAEWHRLLGITRDEVEMLVGDPPQVVPGDMGASVAQARRGVGVLRAVFTQDGDARRIVTLYWTSRVDRYWRA